VSETVAGGTTTYLVDTQNPTGYAQVVDEPVGGTVTRTYGYGLERISESQILSSAWTQSFYGYDGHGSVRQLTRGLAHTCISTVEAAPPFAVFEGWAPRTSIAKFLPICLGA
jgi:hypothetical protein